MSKATMAPLGNNCCLTACNECQPTTVGRVQDLLRMFMAICCLWVGTGTASAAVTPGTSNDGMSGSGMAEPFEGMTPAQIAQAQVVIDKIRTEKGLILPTDTEWENLSKMAQAQRVQEALTYLENQESFSGSNANRDAAKLWSGGGLSLTGQYVNSPRHLRPTRYIQNPGGDFKIVEANENLLDDFNGRLNKLANKLEKSKFACGQFDWVVQLKGKFNKAALEKYVDKLGESALAAAPMAFLANWSPTLYEIVKWLRAYAGAELDSDKIQCSQIEGALTNMGQRMTRGEGYPECIKANQSLGVTEAHRLCNQNNSPFDGMENAAGQIVGLTTGPNQNLNLTTMVGDSMRTPMDASSVEAQNKVAADQKEVDEATALLAASPDPGAPPPGADGSPAVQAWFRSKAKHLNAKKRFDEATKNLKASTVAYNGAMAESGPWARFGNALADNLGDIIGDIDLSGKVNVQFGRQRQYLLLLKYKHLMYEHSLDFTKQLEIHYALIMSSSPPEDDLAESYRHLQAFCFSTFQGPWLDKINWIVKPQVDESPMIMSHDVAFGYLTVDRLAILWTEHQMSDANGIPRTVWPEKYRMIECINLISQFELFDYLVGRAEQDTDAIIAEFESTPAVQNGGPLVLDHIVNAMHEYRDFLVRKRDETLPTLVAAIEAVNNKPLILPGVRGEETIRTLMDPNRTYPQLGR